MTTLDDEISDDIGFVKINVEGHELQVLRGARRTVERCRPVFLIECEERHNPGGIARLFSLFRSADYRGRFLRNGDVLDISRFNLDLHQAQLQNSMPMGHYVNNFFFFPGPPPV